MLHYIYVSSKARNELIDITDQIEEVVRNSGATSGVCHVVTLHTTAAITVNEGADPSVRRDIARFLATLVPVDAPFSHAEGNSDSHVKATLAGASETIIIEGGRLLLGTWQAVYFCEFDGPRARKVAVKILPDP
jgi:secondary thiamine-phosphate synthase enzyme